MTPGPCPVPPHACRRRVALGGMEHFDLVIIGSGSGNSLIDERFDGLRVALVERGIFGCTCLNVGCIPTKMFVLPADHAVAPEQARRLGVAQQTTEVHFDQIRDRIFGRIDPISTGGKQWREQSENVTVFTGTGRFVEIGREIGRAHV